MPRHTKDLIAYSMFEAAHTADVLFKHDQYLEWVIVYPHWEPNDGKLLVHKTGLLVYLANYDTLKEAKTALEKRAEKYTSMLHE